ncbi:MAG: hypothetical protein H6738_06860 [Alphaproteobacteria bacterium]|nr:hypothetical protein [Alphaproteobacteria bacterium]MCB9696482.1 hypothetical protein [Alphaproteobacteria bacterium]
MVPWISVALATTTGSTFTSCPIGAFPDDGDGPISPDAVFVAVGLNPACLGPSDAGIDDVVPIAGQVDFPDARTVRFTPDEPLERGADVVAWATDGWSEQLAELSVGRKPDRLPLSPGVADVDLQLRRRCRWGTPPRVKATVTLESPAAGVLQAQVLTDGISQGWSGVAAGSHMEPGRLVADVASGEHDHCVELRLLDELGEVVWQEDPVCVHAERCPVEEDRGCSTGMAPRSGGWILMFVMFLTRIVRRR